MVPPQIYVWTESLFNSRGPEIESWFGVDDDTDPALDNDWSFLPFMALSDGAHAYCFSFHPVRPMLIIAQSDRGLFILHPPPPSDVKYPRHISLWNLVHEADGRQSTSPSTVGNNQKYGAKGRGSHCR